jgi:hypothetical protein
MRLVGPAQEASRAAVASGHVFGLCGDDLLLAEETARGTAEADLKRSTPRAWGGPRRRSVGRCRGRAGSHGGRPGEDSPSTGPATVVSRPGGRRGRQGAGPGGVSRAAFGRETLGPRVSAVRNQVDKTKVNKRQSAGAGTTCSQVAHEKSS